MLSLFIRKDKIQTAWLYFLPSLTGGKKKGPARCGKRGAADRGKLPLNTKCLKQPSTPSIQLIENFFLWKTASQPLFQSAVQ